MRAHEFISELKFFGSPCTRNCEGHRAGYAWSKKKDKKPQQTNQSFMNGSSIWFNHKDQNLNPISGGITNAKGQFQKFQPGVTEPPKPEPAHAPQLGTKKPQGPNTPPTP